MAPICDSKTSVKQLDGRRSLADDLLIGRMMTW